MVDARDDERSAWEAHARAGQRLADAAHELATAPLWLRAARPDDLADPAQRAEAQRLQQRHAEALTDLAARRRLEVILDALTARGADPSPSTTLLQFRFILPWLNGLASGRQLLDELVADPRRRFLGQPPAFPPDLADAIVGHIQANGPLTTLATLDGQDGRPEMGDWDYWDLIETGLSRQAGPLPDGQAVGVLLPVRLVTRFLGPDADGSWRLRVRVYPDEASRDRTPRPPEAAELHAVAALWDACGGDLAGPLGETAFARLADAAGGARAAWLVRTVTVEPDDQGRFTVRSPDPAPAGTATFDGLALPATLELWARWDDGSAQRLATLHPDAEEAARQLDLQAVVEAAGPGAAVPDVWWTSWSVAGDVGLATEVRLPRPPEQLAVLSVVGLGEPDPGPLWRRQRDSGRLSVLAPGTPTSTVDGAPADLTGDTKAWWQRALASGLEEEASADTSLALTGVGTFLGPLPGGQSDRRRHAERATELLWPVLFGRALHDVWDLGPAADRLADWAARLLSAEGPYPAVRLGDQPYGILPATAASAWAAAAGDPLIEAQMLPVIRALRAELVGRAEAAGNVVGADTQRLLDLLSRRPRSQHLAGRLVVPLALLRRLASLVDLGAFAGIHDDWWRARNNDDIALVADPAELPLRPYVAWSWPHDLPVEAMAGGDAEALARALETLQWVDADGVPRDLVGELELWRHGTDTPGIEDLPDHLWAAGGNPLLETPLPLFARLARHALVLTKADLGRRLAEDRPWQRAYVLPVDRAEQLRDDAHALGMVRPPEPPPGRPDVGAELEDGPVVARRYRRVRAALEALAGAGPDGAAVAEDLLGSLTDVASYRVDPWFTGLANRRLRALLDRGAPTRLGVYGWVDHPRPHALQAPGSADPAPGPTPAGLLHAPSTEQARTAAVLRDQAVAHADDGRWQLTLDSARIRGARGLADAVRAGVPPVEVLGRRVEEIAGDPGTVAALRRQFPMRVEHGARRVCDGAAVLAAVTAGRPVTAALNVEDRAAIAALQGDLDAYADLCVVEGVHQALHRRPEAAAVAMEAAAGLGAPPEFAALNTPREGSAVVTTAVAVLPASSPSDDAGPAELADPAFAAEARARTGTPYGRAWTWSCRVRMAGRAAATTTVTLASLGLAPADVAVLGPAVLDELVAAAARGDRADAAVRVTGAAVRSAQRVRALAALLDGPPDAATALLDRSADDANAARAAATAAREAASADLRARLSALAGAAQAVVAALQGGEAGAIAAARRFGLHAEAAAAAEVLGERLAAVAALLAAGDVGLDALAAGIRSLVGAAGAFPVLAPVPAAAFAGVRRADAAAGGWREVVAAVRERIARLDAWQHATGGSWRAWCDPPDPWGVPADRPATHRVLVAHGPRGAMTGPRVAVVLDRLVETVPSTRQTTGAAFGFNGPRSRAPQAIVLAVPPDIARPLDTETLVAITDDLRLSARARAVGPDDLDDVADLVGLPLLLRTTVAGADPLAQEG